MRCSDNGRANSECFSVSHFCARATTLRVIPFSNICAATSSSLACSEAESEAASSFSRFDEVGAALTVSLSAFSCHRTLFPMLSLCASRSVRQPPQMRLSLPLSSVHSEHLQTSVSRFCRFADELDETGHLRFLVALSLPHMPHSETDSLFLQLQRLQRHRVSVSFVAAMTTRVTRSMTEKLQTLSF